MKGDFSSWHFDPLRNDQGLLFQQGRVMRDADLTEAELIDLHWRSQAARDVIGAGVAAVPAAEPGGFRITRARVDSGNVSVSVLPGRVWADGVLTHLEGDPAAPGAAVERAALYLAPPLNPAGTTAAGIGAGVRDAVILELALEELNGFQDPKRLIEPALGGPDTAERISVRYGFRLLRLGPNEDCSTIRERLADGPEGKGRLTVSLAPTQSSGTECPVVTGGGYTGFEHNLYRIEIAQLGGGGPRFKWSQFNGGLVGRGEFHPASGSTPARVAITANRAAIVNSGLTEFYLEALLRDEELGHWRVVYGARASLNVQSDLELTPVSGAFPSPTAPETTVFFRLWNGLRDVSDFVGHSPPAELRDGVQLDFDAPGPVTYRPGDYWVFPLRAGEIANDEVLVDHQPPQGPVLRRVPLAEIDWSAERDTDAGGSIEDCRRRFRPLTNQKVCCTLLVGDGMTSFGDFNSLEEAARHLPAAGGELCVLPGTHFANLDLVSRRDIRIHGCPGRTLVLPRQERAAEPILRIRDCRRIEIAGLDLVSIEGPAIFASGRRELRELRVVGCRIVARSFAIRVIGGRDVAIERNKLWLWDTEQGRAVVQLGAADALVERNSLGVWPREQRPPRDRPGDRGGDDPAGPCADTGELYRDVAWMRTYAQYVWAGAAEFLPAQPYRAWGGIHLLGGCDTVRLLGNRIDGGLGHGITLGGLLPGAATAMPHKDDRGAAASLTLRERRFVAYVQDESRRPVAGVDVYLDRAGATAYTGASAGAEAAVDIGGVPPGRYTLGVEPGYELLRVSEGDFEGGQFFVLTVRPATFELPEARAFLYRIQVEANEICRMGLSGIGFRPVDDAEPVGIPTPSLDDLGSIVTSLNALLAPRDLLANCNPVRDLEIRGNRIHHNLRAVYDDALRRAARRVGQGGISLALVESAVIAGNHVHDNGASAATPVCGIFIGYGEDVAITDNRIFGNGTVLENYRAERMDGIRGGIFVRFASAFLIGGETDALQRPALRMADNRIDQPAGRAITALAFGPVACSDNYLNSEHDGRYSILDQAVGAVLILNLGGIHRQLMAGTTRRFKAQADGQGLTRFGLQSSPFGDLQLAELLLPGGETLCNGNQVRAGPGNESFLLQLLVTMDDLGYDGNQSSAFRQDLMFGNTVCMAHTLRVTDNRFRERTLQCFFSLLSFAFGYTPFARLMTMNTTAHDQADHCIFALSNAAAGGLPVVSEGNLVLLRQLCPAEPAEIVRFLLVGLGTTLYAQNQAAIAGFDAGTAAQSGMAATLRNVAEFNAAHYRMQRDELARRRAQYGDRDARVVEGAQRVARYGRSIGQLGAQADLAAIKEAAAPDQGVLVDGRVTDEAYRGHGNLKVELVREDGTAIGAAGRTEDSGYFALALDDAQAKELQAGRPVRIRVSDAAGREIHRSEAPIEVAAGEPVRADVVLVRRGVPQAAKSRATVIYGTGIRPPGGEGGSTPLERVKGIGPKTAAKLRAAGIPDLETLLRTPGDRLVDLAGFDAEALRRDAGRVLGEAHPPTTEPSTPEPSRRKPRAPRGRTPRRSPKKR